MKKFFIENKNVFLVVLNAILSSLTIIFAIIFLTKMDEVKSNSYVFGCLLLSTLGLYQIYLLLKAEDKKEKLCCWIIFLIFVLSGVAILFSDKHYIFTGVSIALFLLTFIVKALFNILRTKNKAIIISNIIIILLIGFITVSFLLDFSEELSMLAVIFEILIALALSVLHIIFMAVSKRTTVIFAKILYKTHAAEILLGLLTFIVAFALLLPMFEENITTFRDGLWYGFAVVTTIGFGDVVATSLIGRILTVLLGIYGIIVVAIITSIIVNFYNEVKDEPDNLPLKKKSK